MEQELIKVVVKRPLERGTIEVIENTKISWIWRYVIKFNISHERANS